jgi:hypothetical protein
MDLHVAAGVVSTVIFATSMMPMLVKAARTKNLESYSLGHMVLTNAGNAVHSVYVFSLPVGPIWALHAFYLVTAATMLVWCLRYGTAVKAAETLKAAEAAEAAEPVHRVHHLAVDTVEGPCLDQETWGAAAAATPATRRGAARAQLCRV